MPFFNKNKGETMKVTILKDGTWAINPPHPGEVVVKAGEKRTDISEPLFNRMLKASGGPAAKKG